MRSRRLSILAPCLLIAIVPVFIFLHARELRLSHDLAALKAGHQWGPWRLSRTEALSYAMPAAYFDRLGLPSLRCTPGA